MNAKIKVKADLEKALGKTLANNLLNAARTGHMKKLPYDVTFTNKKPQFCLGDNGDTLTAYGVDLASGTVTGEKYCGCADTILNHFAEQQVEGLQAPDGKAMVFVHSYWNGRNHSWNVTVVSNNFVPQVA